MKISNSRSNLFFTYTLLFLGVSVFGQELKSIEFVPNKLMISSFNKNLKPGTDLPVVSFIIDNEIINENKLNLTDGKVNIEDKISLTWHPEAGFTKGVKGEILFKNISRDTVSLRNVVPFGEDKNHVYITGKGEHHLSRTHLFRPGYAPVNVIVPDNAWELGYSGIPLSEGKAICALTRRTDSKEASKRRFETLIYPGGSVTYTLYADLYEGQWQEGLRKTFQDRYLYDVDKFDNSLYEREDLSWMRHSYVIHLMMAWDDKFYDPKTDKYTLEKFLKRGQKWYGGDDAFGIWPTWPVLGMDQRNQWDYFRDLPGGLDGLKDMVDLTHQYDSKFFICYNPWDESTRLEDHIEGMAKMIQKLEADGVVLDTKGSSSRELQEGADSVRDGVIMYSEGMAVPKDMQGIVSGRVHNALYYPPLLNLNKFIKPDFAIFRVAEIAFERIRREYATSFFNGYGTELNIFRPGEPDWIEDDYRFFGRTVRILRENTSNFIQDAYTPLIPTLEDKVYVNKWPYKGKVVYTIFSVIPEGFQGPLFEVSPEEGYHFVDLWNHTEIETDTLNSKPYAKVDLDGFSSKWLGTNNEGAVGSIAKLPTFLKVSRDSDLLTFSADKGDKIRIWAGRPDYEKEPKEFLPKEQTIGLIDTFGDYEGKFIIQLFKNEELLDERVVQIEPGTPRLVSKVHTTDPVGRTPKGMVRIPEGLFEMQVTQGDDFIPYPPSPVEGKVTVHEFYMDRFPVTNSDYKKFIEDSHYQPKNKVNYLKNWVNGEIPSGQENFPVVYISYEDAKAYSGWAGKRLPTETEWQYAAQTSKLNEWPWGKDSKKIAKKDQFITKTLTVSDYSGIDSTFTNLGNNKMEAVGSHPKGVNPYGLQDLVGSVWQLTNDLYDNTTNRFIIMKGGSYYKPSSSWWYVQGGPRKLTYRQMLLRVSQGFERNATVGFRCVKDAR